MSLALEIALLVGVVYLLWPASLGGRLGLVVVTGHSMEPTHQLGDMVITWKQPVATGDVVLFEVPAGAAKDASVIHRIVGREEGGWVTQGDNNDWIDPWIVPDERVLGVPVFDVPHGTLLLSIYRSPLMVGALFGAAVLLWLWPATDQAQPRSEHRRRSSHPLRRARGGPLLPLGPRHVAA